MTLKEKFRPLVWFNYNSFNVHQNKEKDENSIKCEAIADEYAIGFAQFLGEHTYSCYESGWSNDFGNKLLTTKELLEIYKKENGL